MNALQPNAPPRSVVCVWNKPEHLKLLGATEFPARAREIAPGAGALPNRIQRTAVRVSLGNFSRGTEGKAKGREMASKPSTGWFNNGLE